MEESACKADASETSLLDQWFCKKLPQMSGFDLGNWRAKVHAIQAQKCAPIVLWIRNQRSTFGDNRWRLAPPGKKLNRPTRSA
jgi:hypothetical protein